MSLEQKYAEIKTLQEEIKTLQEKIKSIQYSIKKEQDEAMVKCDVQQLGNLRDYLLKHTVCFERLSLQKLHHATTSYDIGLYTYNLYSFGFRHVGCYTCEKRHDISNIYIERVPLPTNNIERQLYPHVVEYLQPYLPIHFEWYEDSLDEGYGYRLRPQNNAPIGVDLQRGVSVSAYYLMS
jgi:hypothetical protein